jgi:hypothetical protein
VPALAPIYHAMDTEAITTAGRLEHIDPQVWHTPWNVHRQAKPHGHTASQDLAPEVCRVAIANCRLVSRNARIGTCTDRQLGRARLRPTNLDGMECLCRFLQPVLPDGFRNVRHVGFLHARCAISTDTLRRMIMQAQPSGFKPTRIVPPAPLAAFCPTCGAPLRVVMRLWTPNSAVLDTG